MRQSVSIMEIKGIGEKYAALFQKLNISTVEDLLYHFPRDYEKMPEKMPLRLARQQGGKKAAVEGILRGNVSVRRFRGKSMISCTAADDFGDSFSVTYFNMPYLAQNLRRGGRFVFYGTLSEKNGKPSMVQPRLFSPAEYEKKQGVLIPVYPKTKGLSDSSIAKYVKAALSEIPHPAGEEYLPEELLARCGFDSLEKSLYQMHFPTEESALIKARERFSYEELLLFILTVKSRAAARQKNGHKMQKTPAVDRLIGQLPYELTGSQKDALSAITGDLGSPWCCNRLLQGDVGCGKTIVAFLSMLMCVENGFQCALMAPTEVLARQHFEQLSAMTEEYDLPFTPALLVGSTKASEKKRILSELSEGKINALIGTHALIEDPVIFRDLALTIIDEQHRFGVKQRDILQKKGGGSVHTIVMSATPIPRSLAIVLYGELDITEMPDMPARRLPIKNCVVDQTYRPSAYKFMHQEIGKGHQVYVICPMAEPGVMEDLENVQEYAKELREIFPETVKIEYLHGKMRPKQKNEIMERFAAGQVQILVSTTVIEVGVNVPNATVMLVENAERFGLATLHQIRGRVGRGDQQSYCIFMESASGGKENERLSVLNHSNNGFEIARMDLKQRGPGDLTGLQQSGSFSFRFADIYRDHDLLLSAAADADRLLREDPALALPKHKALSERLARYSEEGYLDVL